MSEYRCAVVALLASLCASCAAPVTQLPGVSADELAAEKRQQQAFQREQLILQVKNFVAQSARLENVAHRLTVANRSDCKSSITPKLGWQVISRRELPAAMRDIAGEAMNLDGERPTVVSIAEGGPAGRAGIAVGDVLVSINNAAAPTAGASNWIAQNLHRNGPAPIRVEMSRQGQRHTQTVQPVVGCAIPVGLMPSNTVNAGTTGNLILVNSGILRIAQSDAEIAVIVGHELAHVTMLHVQKKQQNRAAGALGGFLAGWAMDFGDGFQAGLEGRKATDPGRYTREILQDGAFAMDFEREADYVGLYYVANAGYDVLGAERIWRAIAQESPQQIVYAGYHPTTPERFLLLQKTAQEIVEKKRRNQPLTPELKPTQATVQSSSASDAR